VIRVENNNSLFSMGDSLSIKVVHVAPVSGSSAELVLRSPVPKQNPGGGIKPLATTAEGRKHRLSGPLSLGKDGAVLFKLSNHFIV
jgi:hypothetical protein